MAGNSWPKESYRIGIICALSVEAAAVHAVLDEEYDKIETTGDNNNYVFGRIGVHNVVITCLAAGKIGIASAASASRDMCRSFPIAFGLMVGVGGGVWSPKADVRLGDVVVGIPEGQYGGVVQWDSGKTEAGGIFARTGTRHEPPPILLNAVQSLRIKHWATAKGKRELDSYLNYLYTTRSDTVGQMLFPGAAEDVLYDASYDHQGGSRDCNGCDAANIVSRSNVRSLPEAPEIHFGTIASGNQVIKHGLTRDSIARSIGDVLCFEMEAAGLDAFPCLVIRGICDYADSHKNKQWQPYAAITAAVFAKELLEFVDQQERAVKSFSVSPSSQRHFLVPRWNPNFVPRDKANEEINDLIRQQSSGQVRLCISGLGGSGKTQVALDFAHQSRKDHHVFWVHASSIENFLADFKSIGRAVGILEDNCPTQEAWKTVKQWLDSDQSGSWKLILDNLDEVPDTFERALNAVLPDHRGLIFITSRNQDIVGNIISEGSCIRLPEMSISEARNIFKKMSGVSDTEGDSVDADNLLEQIGYLPLAISQAGAYIRRQRITVKAYLKKFQSSEKSLIGLLERPILRLENQQSKVQVSVMTTWEITFKQIQQVNPSAALLLQMMSLLDFQSIPESIALAKSVGSHFVPMEDLDSALATLISFDLISVSDTSDDQICYRIHRLVSLWVRSTIQDKSVLIMALNAIDECFPLTEEEDFLIWNHMVPHASAVLSHAEKFDDLLQACAKIQYKLAVYFIHSCDCWEAETPLNACYGYYNLQSDTLEERLKCLFRLGTLEGKRGEHQRAIERYQEGVQLIELSFDGSHARLSEIQFNIASENYHMGEYDTAFQSFQVFIRRYSSDARSEFFIRAHSNIGAILSDQEKYEDALTYYDKALAGWKQVFGDDHVLTIKSQITMASAYVGLKLYEHALNIYDESIPRLEKAIGKHHHETLQAVSDKSTCLSKIGRDEEALELLKQIHSLQEKRLGEHNRFTLDTLHQIGESYKQIGQYELALQSYEKVKTGCEAAAKNGHLSFEYFYTLDGMGDVYMAQGLYSKAVGSYECAQDGIAKRFSPTDPFRLRILDRKAEALISNNQYEDAMSCYMELIQGRSVCYGPDHELTHETIEKQALLMEKMF